MKQNEKNWGDRKKGENSKKKQGGNWPKIVRKRAKIVKTGKEWFKIEEKIPKIGTKINNNSKNW